MSPVQVWEEPPSRQLTFLETSVTTEVLSFTPSRPIKPLRSSSYIPTLHLSCTIWNMKTHKMHLKDPYFSYIKDGTKRIELRLFDDKRRRIDLGDLIEFSGSNDKSVQARVVGLLHYDSFVDLCKDFNIAILADKAATKDDLMATLNEFYSPEKQVQFGVIGIRFELA